MRAWRSVLVALPFVLGAAVVAALSALLTTPR
jgi:hypothetical protein